MRAILLTLTIFVDLACALLQKFDLDSCLAELNVLETGAAKLRREECEKQKALIELPSELEDTTPELIRGTWIRLFTTRRGSKFWADKLLNNFLTLHFTFCCFTH